MHKKLSGSLFFIVALFSTAQPMLLPLNEAARTGNVEKLRILLQQNPDEVNAHNVYGWAPLHYAAANDQLSCAQELLKYGANVNTQDKNGWTPLHFAAYYGHNTECIRELLMAHAEIDARNHSGQTPLHCAANNSQDHVDCVRKLLNNNAYVNAKDNLGETPLHKAASMGNLECIKKLLEHGANVNA